jgi:LytS/YehU family sensor histidine kinase
MEAMRAEQEKKLSTLRIVSLSNQFRPHFILNALNTVGAELDNKPQAESVLSRLGESIDLIFSHSQQQKIFHSLSNEWKLVENVIDIHRMMYLKQLEVYLPDKNKIETYKQIMVPLGLLQVPVENSLLHGLSNREQGPWNLKIDINEIDSEIIIIITDNGVGRESAAKLSNFRKHGTGTKNLESILSILNKNKSERINIRFEDNIFRNEDTLYGTRTIITIPKNFSSEF